jgi:ABC-2 type transport system ATP-binding protein
VALIEARGLGIQFLTTRRRNLKLRDLFVQGGRRRARANEFWALRNATFSIGAGEAVGVIGRNGTGKSTLLKLIAGVLIPDEGTITTRAQVAPLLELSAGFSGELTGRENVQVVGCLHGLRRAELHRLMPQIFEFAGPQVAAAANLPVRHYSTGMLAQLRHPILLVDEVLAVGDKDFREKCYATIEGMLAEGRTLVLVSHNENDLRRFCTRGLFIDGGVIRTDGSLAEALEAYNSR